MKIKMFWITGLVMLLLVTAGCSIVQRGEQSSPQKLVETYLEAFQSGDFEQMVRLSGEWEGAPEELEFIRRLVEMIELKSYTVDQVEVVSKSEALVRVTVTLALLGQERTQTDWISVLKEEGKWYVVEGIFD